MDAVYYISLVGLIFLTPATLIGAIFFLIKPSKLHSRLGRQVSRRRIAASSLASILVIFFGLGGVMTATEPESARIDREQRQATEAAAIKKAEEEKGRLERQRREREARNSLVEIKTITEEKPIKFKTERRNDSSIPKGVTRVSQKGSEGTKALTYEVTYKGGKEVSRKLVGEETIVAAVTHVILNGTYVAPAAPQPTPSRNYSPSTTRSPQDTQAGVVKMSNSGICHAPGTTYYNRTKNYTPYDSLQACLNAGGRMPLR